METKIREPSESNIPSTNDVSGFDPDKRIDVSHKHDSEPSKEYDVDKRVEVKQNPDASSESSDLTSDQKQETSKQYFDDNGVKYREDNDLVPNTKYELSGYSYETDDKGRIISAEGKLQIKDHDGRKNAEDTRDVVAHGKMDATDDSGHLIGDRFNGNNDLGNLVPMDRVLNRTGDYAKIENTLAGAVNDGADVKMKVEPVYEGNSARPIEFRISYSIDGDRNVVVLKNGSGD